MNFNIITNISNGAGLEVDAQILRERLQALGHTVRLTMFHDMPQEFYCFDVNIFVETVAHHWLCMAKQNWLIPNPEWFLPEWESLLPAFDKILCKTYDAYFRMRALWKPWYKYNCVYTGFESRDRLAVCDSELAFLHLAGKSSTKNTQAVVEAWERFEIPAPLYVSYLNTGHPESYALAQYISRVPNVVYTPRLSDSETTRLMNTCRFHIMPSAYEGWGHVLHEGLSCRAVMITTDAEPMRECQRNGNLLVPVVEHRPLRAGVENVVSAEGVYETVKRALEMSPCEILKTRDIARHSFIKERLEFRSRLACVVNGL